MQFKHEKSHNVVTVIKAKDTSFLLEDSGQTHFDQIINFFKAEKGKTDLNNNLEFIRSTVEDWLQTMHNVIEDRQKHDGEVNDELVGLCN